MYHQLKSITWVMVVTFSVSVLAKQNIPRQTNRATKGVHLSSSQHIQQIYSQLGKMSVDQQSETIEVKSEKILALHQGLRMTQQSLLENDWENAFRYFSQSCQIYIDHQTCANNQCTQFSKEIRNLVRVSHQYGKIYPQQMLRLYRIYLSYFPLDSMMTTSAAEWSLHIQEYSQAMVFYERYILFKKKYIANKMQDKNSKKYQHQKLESIFYLYYQIAQLSKNFNLEVRSYDFYLKHSSAKQFVIKVQFLKNVALFNLKQYFRVAPVFRGIAFSNYEDILVREKSAEYALKALQRMRKPIIVRKWAFEFSVLFPHKADVYNHIVQQLNLPS